jgi:hypothetical protein
MQVTSPCNLVIRVTAPRARREPVPRATLPSVLGRARHVLYWLLATPVLVVLRPVAALATWPAITARRLGMVVRGALVVHVMTMRLTLLCNLVTLATAPRARRELVPTATLPLLLGRTRHVTLSPAIL